MNPESADKFISSVLSYGRKKPKAANNKYGGFNRRMLAVTIDSFFLLIFAPLIDQVAPMSENLLENYAIDPSDPQLSKHVLMHILANHHFFEAWFTNFFMQMLVWCVYTAICLHFWSATPGKILLRMKVVDAKTEGRINDGQVFLRSFGYMISMAFFGLGFLWILVNKRRCGWHDYFADTVVINLPVQFWKKSPNPSEKLDYYETPSD